MSLSDFKLANPHIDFSREFFALFRSPSEQENFCGVSLIQNVHRASKKMGYVYCIVSSTNPPFYKIGRAGDVSQRISTIGILMPFSTELVHIIGSNDVILAERYWHNKFDKYRSNGEWFMLPRERLDEMTNIETMLWMQEYEINSFVEMWDTYK